MAAARRARREDDARRAAGPAETEGAAGAGGRLRGWLVGLWLAAAPRSALRFVEPRPRDLGPLGERLAAQCLTRSGLRLVARNLRRRECEVDLLLLDGDELVAVEVKCTRCPLEQRLGERRYRPLDRVGPVRRQRLARAAAGLRRSTGRPTRVDVVEVWIAGPRRHLDWAWHRGVLPRA